MYYRRQRDKKINNSTWDVLLRYTPTSTLTNSGWHSSKTNCCTFSMWHFNSSCTTRTVSLPLPFCSFIWQDQDNNCHLWNMWRGPPHSLVWVYLKPDWRQVVKILHYILSQNKHRTWKAQTTRPCKHKEATGRHVKTITHTHQCPPWECAHK